MGARKHGIEKISTFWSQKNGSQIFLKDYLLFQYDPISGNLERISPIRLKTANQIFRLKFKLKKKDYKRATHIKQEKKLAKLERKGIERKGDWHPPNSCIIPKSYLYNALWNTRLVDMDINTLKHNDNKVKSCNEKGNVVKGEKLLLQLTVHVVEETFAKTFARKLANGERFQN